MQQVAGAGGGLAEKQQGDLVGVTGDFCLAGVLFGKPCRWGVWIYPDAGCHAGLCQRRSDAVGDIGG